MSLISFKALYQREMSNTQHHLILNSSSTLYILYMVMLVLLLYLSVSYSVPALLLIIRTCKLLCWLSEDTVLSTTPETTVSPSHPWWNPCIFSKLSTSLVLRIETCEIEGAERSNKRMQIVRQLVCAYTCTETDFQSKQKDAVFDGFKFLRGLMYCSNIVGIFWFEYGECMKCDLPCLHPWHIVRSRLKTKELNVHTFNVHIYK